ncbi:cytoplasmic protein [Corynebacterium yudongzhengii]|uniref:DfsB family protein n=1 Tax=Corynebacterium yudongzhengii TaxID=2080740 RepID=A0A2U1T5P8_9CORY|nr:ClbS/DfsB family four-helix bundle protein [Corynebacterium yudongzhengii]AWB82578.1 cytoplasmic protein [Corynebacterium yudongzhengii]PWC01312.1 DfsB family protein [Corynebacterium yudongzhengii]
MKTYESGAELAAEVAKRGGLFIGEFADVADDDWDLLVEGVDRTPRQMIAYQLGWLQLLLGWERDEQAGIDVVTPAPGFKWDQLGGLYAQFYQRWEKVPAKELVDQFRVLLGEIIQMVEGFTEAELFEPHQRAWASSTPSAWPVWKWVHINTVAPFTTFRTKIRKFKKLTAAG